MKHIYSSRLLDSAKEIDTELRKRICDRWMYSKSEYYQSFDDYPEYIRIALCEVAMSAIQKYLSQPL